MVKKEKASGLGIDSNTEQNGNNDIRLSTNPKEYLSIIQSSKNNIVVDFNDAENIKKEINYIVNSENRIGYLAIKDYIISNDIKEHLNIDTNLLLLLPKGKIKQAINDRKIEAPKLLKILDDATKKPVVIVYDSNRKNYQFYVEYKNFEGYRYTFAFETAPDGIPSIKANILMSFFRNDNFENHIENLKKNSDKIRTVIYEKGEWLAVIATDSPSTNNVSSNKGNVKSSK